MKSSLMKLMSGVFAALVTGGVFAEDTVDWPYIFWQCDLAQQAYSDNPYDYSAVICGQGQTRTYSLGADLKQNIILWRCMTEWWLPDRASTAIFDFSGGHTYYIPNVLALLCYSENHAGLDSAQYARPNMYVRNATIDGQAPGQEGQGWMTIGQYDTVSSFTNGFIQIENSTLTNLSTLYIGRQMANSEVVFKNATVSAYNVEFSDWNYWGEENLTLTFDNTKFTVLNHLDTDSGNGYTDISYDIGRRYVFKGSENVMHVVSTIDAAKGISYGEILLDDGAQLVTDCGLYFGIGTANVRGWKVTVQNNAVLQTGWGTYFGWDSGRHTMIIKDGGALKGTINVGRYTDYNTLIVTNGDLSGCGSMTIGGCGDGPKGAPNGNRALIHGQKTTFNASPFNDIPFRGKNGLLYLDDVTVSPRKTYYLSPVNPNQTSEDDAWENNTMFLDNGTYLAATDFLMGNFYADSMAANKQNLIVGNNATLDVQNQFMNSGYANSIIISNGTIQAGSQWGFYVGYYVDETTQHTVAENKLIFKGNHPRVQKKSQQYGESYIATDTTLRFELPEDGEYKQIPYEFDHIVIGHAVNIEFGNLDKVRDAIIGTKEIALIRGDLETGIDYAGEERTAGLNIQQETLDAANAKLEEEGFKGCKVHIVFDESCSHKGTVYLTVKSAAAEKPGAVLMIK